MLGKRLGNVELDVKKKEEKLFIGEIKAPEPRGVLYIVARVFRVEEAAQPLQNQDFNLIKIQFEMCIKTRLKTATVLLFLFFP